MVVISLIWHILMLPQAAGQPVCSLTINVVDNNGQQVHAYVTVIEQGGRKIEKRHDPGGVRFCDLGIRPVKVEVRPISISCKWAFSEVVELAWSEETSERIVVPSSPCKYSGPNLANNCTVLLRTKDEDGNWVGGSKVVLMTPSKQTIVTDRYGRALLTVPIGSLVTGKMIAEEHRPSEFKFTCNEPIMEQQIELRWGH